MLADVAKAGQDHLHGRGAVLHAAGPHMQGGNQDQEPAQRSQVEDIDDARARKSRICDEARQRQREQHPAQRRARQCWRTGRLRRPR